jgi:predicted nucleotidyltransferase component of viral defense system
MSVSLEYLTQCAAETGYRVESLEKVVRLGDLASDIARHPLLGPVLALKGGTALNLCYGPPKRLSIDLDYNYVGEIERRKMLEDRTRVETAAAEIAKRQGYRVQQSADAFAGRTLYLRYRSVLGQEERIELDLNFLFRMPLAGTALRELWQPGELDRPSVRAVSLDEVLVGKLLALLDRGAARDVWDVANLPSQAEKVLRKPSFRSWFIALATMLPHPLPTYSRERLETRINERVISEQLAPMLARKVKLDSARLVGNAWSTVSKLLELGPNEEAFTAAVQNGELPTELIFRNDKEEARRAAIHPAIQWKIENVRGHIAQGVKKRKKPPQSKRPI